MFIRFACILLICCRASLFTDENKVVYLLSTARSMSTMFLRMMESRGDFVIYNEPTILFYYRDYPGYTLECEAKDAFHDFDEVKKSVFAAQKKENVFIKDMAFTAYPHLLGDCDLLENPSIYFVLLVRDPHHVILSKYKKTQNISFKYSEMLGFQRLYEEYEVLKRISPNGVKIIFSKDLSEKPREVMQAYCKHISIPFSEKAFSWKVKDEAFNPSKAWHEQKSKNITDFWHKSALETTGIWKRQGYAKDEMGNPTFEEIEDENERKAFMGYYHENLVYYKKFLESKDEICL